MNEKLAELKKAANRLPLSPGVYIMKDKNETIIYIGKAKALKNRVTQYFGAGNQHTDKVRRMVDNVDHFEYIICDSEFEALILESSLIKQNKPKYNILLKDDKGYHYIKITKEKWRKIKTAMQIESDGAEYIGPYYSGYVVKDTVDELRKIFMLPDCNRSFDKPSKPCLNYHIGRCDAPCRGKITLQEYNETLASAVKFIKDGGESMIESLEERMQKASDNLDFEYAAKLRDRIRAITKTGEKQKVVSTTYKEQDVFASSTLGEKVCISVFVFRNYRLSDKKHFFVDNTGDKAEMYSQFLMQYYSLCGDIPSRILLDISTSDDTILAAYLSREKGKKVSVIKPQKGEQNEIVRMCRKNADDQLGGINDRTGHEMAALNELSVLLGLPEVPRIIESYDISHTAGDSNVAGMIVFRDGKPYKPYYKRFKIKSFVGADDYRSLAEVLDRRFSEYEKAQDEGFSTLPDLILLDGGRGQLSAVEPILRKHGVNVPMFGMVKDSKHRTRAVTAGGADIGIKANRAAFTLVTKIQDEVHRFAITYHKSTHSKKMLASELLLIEGVGENRRKLLLKTFKTLKAIKTASVEELCKCPGIPQNIAQNIYNYYHN